MLTDPRIMRLGFRFMSSRARFLQLDAKFEIPSRPWEGREGGGGGINSGTLIRTPAKKSPICDVYSLIQGQIHAPYS